jgi:hypothetical protein
MFLFKDMGFGNNLAPRILMSALVGEKLFPKTKSSPFISDDEPINNICAIQITSDTRKYISNVFHALALPWELCPLGDAKSVRDFLTKYYEGNLIELFDEAFRLYSVWCVSNKATLSMTSVKRALQKFISAKEVVFYGAGYQMKRLIELFEVCNLLFDYPIWDINAAKIQNCNGHTVSIPDFETEVKNVNAIIMIQDEAAFNIAESKLRAIGFNCVNGVHELLEKGIIKND